MRRYLLLTLTILLIVLIQTSFFNEFFSPVVNPLLILSFSFSLLFHGRMSEALYSAFVGGLLIDLLGFGVVGITPLLFIVFLQTASFLKRYILRNIIYQTASVILASPLYFLISGFSELQLNWDLFAGAILTGLFVLIFYVMHTNFFGKMFTAEIKYRSKAY